MKSKHQTKKINWIAYQCIVCYSQKQASPLFFFFLSCFAPGKENTCRRKQKELKADKDVNGRLVRGGRKRLDEEGDKQLKKHKNIDKKHKWKHKNVFTPFPFSRLQTKVRFFQRDSRNYALQKFPNKLKSTFFFNKCRRSLRAWTWTIAAFKTED